MAVHVTGPAPACIRRTLCAAVFDTSAVPLDEAPNTSDVRSTDIAGIVTVSAAALLVAAPALLVNTARNWLPLSAGTAVKEYVLLFALSMSVNVDPPFLLTCHLTAAGDPPADAENEATPPGDAV